MNKFKELQKQNAIGGVNVPSYDSNALHMQEARIKDYRVFDGTFQVTVYLESGVILGGSRYTNGQWEEGVWIPYLTSLLTALGSDGPPRTGQKVMLIYPGNSPQKGIAIRCQERGSVLGADAASPTQTAGFFFSVGNW